jgi:small subunit ribosomal protein S6
MNNYESMIIINPALSEEEAIKENNDFLNFVKENAGEITNTDKWGKRKLAFEIDKRKEGYYFINFFSISPEKIVKIDRYYKLNANIFRSNMLVKEK